MPALAPPITALVLPHREAAEVDRRHVEFCEELGAYSPVGRALARLAAVMSVRAERCADSENARLVDRARRALSEFDPPPGLDPADLKRLRSEAEFRAMFDPSDEAKEARRYEAAAVRTFLRALKELQRMKKAAAVEAAKAEEEALGSFLPGDLTDTEFDAIYAGVVAATAPKSTAPAAPPAGPASPRVAEVPFAISKRR